MNSDAIQLALVILLSIGFLIMLTMSIILVSLMIAVMKNLKRISERADEATSNVAGIISTVSDKLAPIAASGIMAMLVKRFTGEKSGSKGK